MTNQSRNIPDHSDQLQGKPQLPPSTWKLSILATAPLPLLIGAVALFDIILPSPSQLNNSLIFEPAYLNTSLQIIFLSFTSFAVAYISLKGYLQTGSLTLVLLGCGALSWGSASLLAGLFTKLSSGPNIAITISNTGALVASILHTSGGTLSSGTQPHHTNPGRRKTVSTISYGAVLGFIGALTLLSFSGTVSPFFVPGVGQTFLRMVVLGAGASLFAAASLLFAKLYMSSASRTLYWYSLALALTSVGLAAVFFGRAPGDPISWTGRTAQMLGGIYFLQSVRTTFRAPTRPA